jgi:type IV secretion system protein VirB7
MNRIIVAGLLMFSVVGCASLTGPRGAPSCDGYSRRPLNRSMWDWENAKPAAPAVASPALPVEPAAPVSSLIRKSGVAGASGVPAVSSRPMLSPKIDVAASAQPCTGEHGNG